MSTSSAIATVTATLRHLLEQATSADDVTTLPPGIARAERIGTQINVFLYKTDINTAFSNFPMPGTAMQNEMSAPPLALSLRYLLTSYGDNNDDISGQQIIGESMLALHDHPVLSRQMINGIAPDSGLHNQIERVRICNDPISVDELTRLWPIFQTDYRLSQTYEVSVTLLESERPAVSPLPVLRRGAGDEGVFVQPNMEPQFPTLLEVRIADQNTETIAGEQVVLQGSRLDAAEVAVQFDGLRLAAPQMVTAINATATEITLQMPDAADVLPAGVYRVRVLLDNGPNRRQTNVLPVAIAPVIGNFQVAGAANNRRLDLDIGAALAPGQEAVLLLGDRQFTDPANLAPTTLRFQLGAVPAGDHLVRLRVDGVDSRYIDHTTTPPSFLAGVRVNFP